MTNDSALNFGCKLAANMSVPRCAVFEVIDETKQFLNCIVDGMQSLVLPWLKQEYVNDFQSEKWRWESVKSTP